MWMKRGVKSVLESCVISILFWVSQVVEIKDEREKYMTKKAFSFFCPQFLYYCIIDTNAFVFRLVWIRFCLLYIHWVLLHNHLLLEEFSWLNEMYSPQSLTKRTGCIRFDWFAFKTSHCFFTHYETIPLSMLSNHPCSSSSGCELAFLVFSLQNHKAESPEFLYNITQNLHSTLQHCT